MQLVHLLAGYVERGSTLSEEYRQLYNCGDAFIGTRMLDCRSGNIICIDEHNWHLVVADIIDKTRRLLVAR